MRLSFYTGVALAALAFNPQQVAAVRINEVQKGEVDEIALT